MLPDPVRAGGHRRGRAALRRQADRRTRGKRPRAVTGDENTLAWANLTWRCAERVLIRIGTFKAKTFDQLFEGVKALPWEQFIPADGAFPVKGHSLDSALHSIPDCQKINQKGSCIAPGRKVRSNLV